MLYLLDFEVHLFELFFYLGCNLVPLLHTKIKKIQMSNVM